MTENPSAREMCRHVLVEWVKYWPEPERWKHEVRWMDDGVAVQSQRTDPDNVWSISAFFNRTAIECGSGNQVRWQCLQCWRELHTAIAQAAQTGEP